jgi:catechol 2,3-dioxygenase-like lactoylglutathione lyase family enzyme
MTSHLHHVSLFVSDMERSLCLFRDILGFDLKWRSPSVGGKKLSSLLGIPDLEMELAYLKSPANGVAVELARLIRPVMNSPAVRFGGAGTVGLSLIVKDLEGLHRRMTQEGWTPFSPPMEMRSPEGDAVRIFCVKTEDGLTLELIEEVGGSSLKQQRP